MDDHAKKVRLSPDLDALQHRLPPVKAQFNSGASVRDTEASGEDCETLKSWKEARGIDPTKQIRVIKLAHIRFQHPNLDVISQFLQDFGMDVVKQTTDRLWLRGYSNDPYVYYAQRGAKKFLGGTFEVETHDDLVKASRLPTSSPIQMLSDDPGKGSMVTAYDAEGMPINFIHGQAPAQAGEVPQQLVLNHEVNKPRKRRFQRFEQGPAAVHKVCTAIYGKVVTVR